MESQKVKNTPSPLTGEGQGEGEESGNFKKLFIPLPFIPSHQGRGNLTFYPIFVIPAKAGIQLIQAVLDSCFRRSDGFFDFLREHQYFNLN